MEGGQGVLSTSQFQSAPVSIQLETSTVQTMLADARSILGQFTSVKMHHLLLIKNSPRYENGALKFVSVKIGIKMSLKSSIYYNLYTFKH